jgi:hypothetical protein
MEAKDLSLRTNPKSFSSKPPVNKLKSSVNKFTISSKLFSSKLHDTKKKPLNQEFDEEPFSTMKIPKKDTTNYNTMFDDFLPIET